MSIRRRMTLSLLAAMILLLGGAGGALLAYLRTQIIGRFDDAQLAKARAVGSLIHRKSATKVDIDFSDEAMPEFERSKKAEFFELWSAAGKPLVRSDSLGKADLPIPGADMVAPSHANIVLPDGRPGRAAAIPIAVRSDQEDDDVESAYKSGPAERYILAVAQDRSSLDSTLATIGWAIAPTAIGLTAATGLLMPWLIRRNLQPLDQIAAWANRIDVSSLAARFPADQMPEELQPICARLNDSLDRLETAFVRKRRFSADVAHELRTPIAELRLLTEIALRFPRDAEAAQKSFRDGFEIATQMEAIVSSLLAMLEDDAVLPDDQLAPVDLAELIEDICRTHQVVAAAKNISWKRDFAEIGRVRSDRVILRGILMNLIGNAVEYSPPGSVVECALVSENGSVTLRIRNPAANLEAADLGHLAEPFWRKDAARTSHRHVGLGLSLVACYARRLNITIEYALVEPHVFQAMLKFGRPEN